MCADRYITAPTEAQFDLGGEVGRRLAAVTEQWILPVPYANPAILEMFRDRDRRPYRNMVPWAGEFAGKYLTHAVQIYRLTRDARIYDLLQWFVAELISLQDEDGYLGPWPREMRIIGKAPNCEFGGQTWDAWGHYHVMLGLLYWHAESRDADSLACCRRIADMFCRRFLAGDDSLYDAGAHEMNQAPVHALAMLHRRTGDERYLRMALKIVDEFALPPAGDYLRAGLADVPFWKTPKPRWESLHPILGLAELYQITGDAQYRQAFENLWWSMLEGDRHNNGGFTSGEQATGDPYHQGAIETCCTVAWTAMSVEMLRLTGNSLVADELELSLFNAGFALMSPSGRWVTYNTPMNGDLKASAHAIVFQARPGAPELNCCSANGPRMLGMIGDWALLGYGDGVALNYYGPGTLGAGLLSGNRVSLQQETHYPYESEVRIAVAVERTETFPLALRIPSWSKHTTVTVNGETMPASTPGVYLEITRTWVTGDQVSLTFDLTPHLWVCGEMYISTDWTAEWHVFGPIPPLASDSTKHELIATHDIQPAVETIAVLPDHMQIDGKNYTAVPVRSEGGILDSRRIFLNVPDRAIMLALTEIIAEQEEVLTVCFTADWWTAWYVNGEKVFDNHGREGDGSNYHVRHQTVRFPLRTGRNVIALHQSGGTEKDAWISLGMCETEAERAARLSGGTEATAFIYRGPILLTYDPRFNPQREGRDLPTINAAGMVLTPVQHDGWLKPAGLWETTGIDGQPIRLCDFGHAGLAGNGYYSWLPVRMPESLTTPFTRENPLRSRTVSSLVAR